MAVLVDKAALGLVLRVHFAARVAVAVAVGHGNGGQLHATLLRGDDAVAVGAHTPHHVCLWRLGHVCFGKQSEFLEEALEKQFRTIAEDQHAQEKVGRNRILLEGILLAPWDVRRWRQQQWQRGLIRSLS